MNKTVYIVLENYYPFKSNKNDCRTTICSVWDNKADADIALVKEYNDIYDLINHMDSVKTGPIDFIHPFDGEYAEIDDINGSAWELKVLTTICQNNSMN